MTLSPLQRFWMKQTTIHNLQTEIPYMLSLPDGSKLPVEVRLKGYGGKKGMLLISDCAQIAEHCNEIVDMGFASSCLSQPSEDEIESGHADYLLDDWGKVQ